ncbi:MAG: TPM domain-containing protein [Treponema sp.]|nr:TPM domain-containing protein [Treponema sp.]
MKKIILILCLPVFLTAGVSAQERIADNANLLSAGEERNLLNLLNAISSKYKFDLVIVTENNIGNSMPRDYADDFFDYNGYGFGADRDGCLFLQVIGTRDIWTSTSGRGIDILNETALNKVLSDAAKYLKAGNTYKAYHSFLVNWEEFLFLEAKGRRYNIIQQWHLVIMSMAWALALAIGFIIVQTWKSGMNTALSQTQAAAYAVAGSLVFNVKKDIFLYSTVTKTERQNDNLSSGGGGRMHTGSSGRSHGGGGRRY